MNSRILGMMLVGASLMLGATKEPKPLPGTDAAIAAQVRHEVLTYSRYTIWDEVGFSVNQGQVQLTGAVSQPFKKSDIEHIVRDIPGVVSVSDQIKVLPLSDFDNSLRLQVARSIYRDPTLSRYAMGAIPAIHIIVDNGRVTLTGVVASDMEKQIAGMRANSSMSFGNVVNNLQVEHPSKKS